MIGEGDEDEDDGPTKVVDNWQAKLYEKSRDYRNGGTLRDYQLDGLNWLLRCWYSKRSSILADEMVGLCICLSATLLVVMIIALRF